MQNFSSAWQQFEQDKRGVSSGSKRAGGSKRKRNQSQFSVEDVERYIERGSSSSSSSSSCPSSASPGDAQVPPPGAGAHVCFLVICISRLPHLRLLKHYAAASSSLEDVQVSFIVHYKEPPAGGNCAEEDVDFFKRHSLRWTRKPGWGSVQISAAMIDLLKEGCSRGCQDGRYLLSCGDGDGDGPLGSAKRRPGPVTLFCYISESCVPCAPLSSMLRLKTTINASPSPNNGYCTEKQFGKVHDAIKERVGKGDQWACLEGSVGRMVAQWWGDREGVLVNGEWKEDKAKGEGDAKEKKNENESESESFGSNEKKKKCKVSTGEHLLSPPAPGTGGSGGEEVMESADEEMEKGKEKEKKEEEEEEKEKGKEKQKENEKEEEEDASNLSMRLPYRPLPYNSLLSILFKKTTASDELWLPTTLTILKLLKISEASKSLRPNPVGDGTGKAEKVYEDGEGSNKIGIEIRRSTHVDWSVSERNVSIAHPMEYEDWREAVKEGRNKNCVFVRKVKGIVDVQQWQALIEGEEGGGGTAEALA